MRAVIVKPFFDPHTMWQVRRSLQLFGETIDVLSGNISIAVYSMQLRGARKIPDGRRRHGAVKHARDELRRARKRALRR